MGVIFQEKNKTCNHKSECECVYSIQRCEYYDQHVNFDEFFLHIRKDCKFGKKIEMLMQQAREENSQEKKITFVRETLKIISHIKIFKIFFYIIRVSDTFDENFLSDLLARTAIINIYKHLYSVRFEHQILPPCLHIISETIFNIRESLFDLHLRVIDSLEDELIEDGINVNYLRYGVAFREKYGGSTLSEEVTVESCQAWPLKSKNRRNFVYM